MIEDLILDVVDLLLRGVLKSADPALLARGEAWYTGASPSRTHEAAGDTQLESGSADVALAREGR